MSLGIGFVSFFLFVLGLAAPLTPSQGFPSPIDLFIFLGAPLLLVGWGIYFANIALVKVLLSLEMVVIVIVSTGVLIPIYQTA